MATYRIYAECEHCQKRHPLPFGFSMDKLIPEETSISEIFKDDRPPKSIISIIQYHKKCPNTGNEVQLTDFRNIYIVPTGNNNSD